MVSKIDLVLCQIKEIKKEQEEIHNITHAIDKKTGIIEEHLKGVNGRLGKHDTSIGNLWKQSSKNKINIVKLTTILTIGWTFLLTLLKYFKLI